MRHIRIALLVIALLISLVYSASVLMDNSMTTLQLVNEQNVKSHSHKLTRTTSSNSQTPINSKHTSLGSDTELKKKDPRQQANTRLSLPIDFMLVGIQLSSDTSLPKALIEYQGELYEYLLDEEILSQNITIKHIVDKKIVVEYKGTLFDVALTGPNLLLEDTNNDGERNAMLAMTPQQIGARPRIIEHLVILIPTPYIADGVIIRPGLNPALFSQVGFEDDDVLKKINGKSVTIEDELMAIKEELKTAHTLEFEVMRKGRMITLYLDIPSEALELTNDS